MGGLERTSAIANGRPPPTASGEVATATLLQWGDVVVRPQGPDRTVQDRGPCGGSITSWQGQPARLQRFTGRGRSISVRMAPNPLRHEEIVARQEFTDIGEMPGYHDRMCKLFALATGLVGMYVGNHESRSIPQISARSENIHLYHYPIRSYAQFERKVVQGHRAALKASGGPSASWHWLEYYQAWENGNLPRLYEELAAKSRISQDDTMSRLFRGGVEANH